MYVRTVAEVLILMINKIMIICMYAGGFFNLL